MLPRHYIPPHPIELSSLFRFFSFWDRSFRYYFTSTIQKTVFVTYHYDEIRNFGSYSYSSATSYTVTPTPMKTRPTSLPNTAYSTGCCCEGLLECSFELRNTLMHWQSNGYCFGFNGMEADNEIKGSGNSYDFGARIYDSRLGRWLAVDPLTKSYPWYTPYQFAGNKPIIAIDLDGLEELLVVRWYDDKKYVGLTYHYITSEQRIYNQGAIYTNASVHNANDLLTFKVEATPNHERNSFSLNPIGDSQKKLSNEAMDAFFCLNSDNQRIFKQGVDYSPTLRNANYEGKNISAIRSFVRTGTGGSIPAEYPGKYTVQYHYDNSNSLLLNLSKGIVNGYIKFLNNNPDFGLLIEGHTSTEGSEKYNLNLGLERAKDVAKHMNRGGISNNRMKVDSKGESQPIENPDDSDTKRATNRRVEITNEPIIQ